MCANVHLQPIVILNEIYNVGVFSQCTTLLFARHVDEMVWCNSCSYTAHVSFLWYQYHGEQPPPLSAPLYISYLLLCSSSLSLPCFSLKCFRFYLSVSVTSLSLPFFSPFPSLSQTVDWYGNTRLRVFLALPQMGPWQHVRDQNVLYLSCQAVPQDQNGSRPLGVEDGEGEKPLFPFLHSLNWGFNRVFWHG